MCNGGLQGARGVLWVNMLHYNKPNLKMMCCIDYLFFPHCTTIHSSFKAQFTDFNWTHYFWGILYQLLMLAYTSWHTLRRVRWMWTPWHWYEFCGWIRALHYQHGKHSLIRCLQSLGEPSSKGSSAGRRGQDPLLHPSLHFLRGYGSRNYAQNILIIGIGTN